MSMKKLKRVVIKEELVALTGKVNEAIVLNQMIYWSERVKDTDNFLKEEMERARKFMDGSKEDEEDIKENLLNGWIYKTSDEMIDETMLKVSRQTMDRVFKNLVDNKWISRRRNPKYKWDKTWQYRVDLYKIQSDLIQLGFSLEGYSLPNKGFEQSNDHGEHSNDHGEHSNDHGEHSNDHGEQAIPESTSETTPPITSDFEEEEEIINIAYFILGDFLTKKGVAKKTIQATLRECKKSGLELFNIKDAKNQFDFMIEKIENGAETVHKNFPFYFATGLDMRTNQSNVSQLHLKEKLLEEQEKVNQANANNKKRDTSFYYNWLEPENA